MDKKTADDILRDLYGGRNTVASFGPSYVEVIVAFARPYIETENDELMVRSYWNTIDQVAKEYLENILRNRKFYNCTQNKTNNLHRPNVIDQRGAFAKFN